MTFPSIVVLTGAGLSAESGLPTFRGAGGLWEGHRAQDVATPEAFARDPQLVHRFYNFRRRQLLAPGIAPNAAHEALAELDRCWPGELLVVTQNVDDLHARAGARRLLPMHGELMRQRCTACGAAGSIAGDLSPSSSCPACGEAGRQRPDIVWFGELPRGLDVIAAALAHCDLFVAIGTSGAVYPAAGFVEEALRRGAHTVEINLASSEVSRHFAEHRRGPATILVPPFVTDLLERHGRR